MRQRIRIESEPDQCIPTCYTQLFQAAIAIAGDEGVTRFDGTGVSSPSPVLFSLGTALLPFIVSVPGAVRVGFVSLSPLSKTGVTVPSTFSDFANACVFQDGSCQRMPVKLFSRSGCFSHLRQGDPVRSRARRPAFIAPVLAFGPNRCAAATLPNSPSSLN